MTDTARGLLDFRSERCEGCERLATSEELNAKGFCILCAAIAFLQYGARSAELAGVAIVHGPRWAPYLTNRCTHCGQEATDFWRRFKAQHEIARDREGKPYVIVGCDGYYQIDPALVGLSRPTWTDWTKEK